LVRYHGAALRLPPVGGPVQSYSSPQATACDARPPRTATATRHRDSFRDGDDDSNGDRDSNPSAIQLLIVGMGN